jgi:serine/threonine-protein kinase RIO1
MVNTYLVHGDIHARNILANDRYSYLIDFAWVDNAHRMKDFTLLEVSIKHMLINETLKYSPHRERIYITQEEYMNFLALINYVFELADYQICSNDALIDKIFLKAFESIKIIRKYAKKCLSQTFNSSFLNYEQEYFYSSFLVLYGMVGMNTIDENSLMLDLAQIAKKYKGEYR